MGMFIIYIAAFVAYLAIGLSPVAKVLDVEPSVVQYALGAIGLLVLVHQRASVVFLRYYFYWTRARQWLTNPDCRWSVSITYRGTFPDDVFRRVRDSILDKSTTRQPVELHGVTTNSIRFSIKESMTFHLEFEPRTASGQDVDVIGVRLAPLEVGSNSAVRKMETEFVPFVEQLRQVLKPDSESYLLSIDFLGANPFYSRYMQHLRADDVEDFHINLVVNQYGTGGVRERVEIKKDGVDIATHSLANMTELARDFLYQSPRLGALLPLNHA